MSIELFKLVTALGETLYMVLVPSFIAALFGIPLGVLLQTTRKDGVLASTFTHRLLASLINATRSIPFIILMIAIIPFTRFIIGTSIGIQAAIVPLTISAIPFIARIVQNALAEVTNGLIEAGLAMGANPLQIIVKILLPEAMPSIVNGLTLTTINLVGYSAMAGAIGGGGLGDLAIRYGYMRFDFGVMLSTVIILIMLVQLLQMLGDFIVSKLSKPKFC